MLRELVVVPGNDSGSRELHQGLSGARRLVPGVLGLRCNAQARSPGVGVGGAQMQSGAAEDAEQLAQPLQSSHVGQVESQFLWQEQSVSTDCRATAPRTGDDHGDDSKRRRRRRGQGRSLSATASAHDHGLALHSNAKLNIRR